MYNTVFNPFQKSTSALLLTACCMAIQCSHSFTLSTFSTSRLHDHCHHRHHHRPDNHSPRAIHRQKQVLHAVQQNKGKGYQQIGAPINPNICSLTKSEIIQRLKERSKARRSRNFQKADEILSNLKRDNVFVNDATKQWRADGRSFIDFTSPNAAASGATGNVFGQDKGESRDYVEYTKARNSRSISSRDEEYVLNKLKERYDAKLNRDYDTADDILDELRFLKNVEIDDTKRIFRVVDPFKVEYTFGGKRINNIHPDILQDIESKIKERANAKKNKHYDLADHILNELTEKHAVRIDDMKKEWHFMRKKSNGTASAGIDLEREEKNENQRRGKVRDDDDDDSSRRRRIDSSISDWSIVENDGSKDNEMPEGIAFVDSINDEIPEGIALAANDDDYDGEEEEEEEHQIPLPDQSKADLESLTVPILKEKLREAGLPVSGRKMDLIERLMNNNT